MFDFFRRKASSGAQTALADHGLSNNMQGPGAGPWSAGDSCPHCKNTVSRREWMAKICESCGHSVYDCFGWQKCATRRVVHGGRWLQQRRIYGVEYLSADGKTWLREQDWPGPSA